jgi:hypothetical protein
MRRGLDEDPWVMTSRVQMRVPNETLGYGLEIAVYERKKAEPGNQHESALQSLEYGDQAHAAGDAVAGLWLAQFLGLR